MTDNTDPGTDGHVPSHALRRWVREAQQAVADARERRVPGRDAVTG